MAVNRIQVSCDGYSGDAASIVTLVELRVDGELMVSLPSPRSFSGAWKLEGDHVVQVWDRTAGNDYDREWGETTHGGPDSVLHATFTVSCPVTTTTEPATTVAETTTPAAPTTTQAPEPTVTVALEPTTDDATTTEVALNTAPVPQSTPSTIVNYSGQDLYTIVSTPEPIGCCADYVAEVQQPSLAATGSNTGELLGVGAVFLLLGVLALTVTRR